MALEHKHLMKGTPLQIALASALFLFWLEPGPLFAQTIEGPYPTKNRNQTNRFTEPAHFITAEISDFRLRHCDLATLTQRVKRSVCIFDLAGLTLLPTPPDQRRVASQEVKVRGDSMTMKEVLRSVGMGGWKGGQPQIKLVSRNLIMQSPIVSMNPKPQEVEEFLKAKVFPGDFVVVARIQ